jgi:phosphatidylserine decarboxylase
MMNILYLLPKNSLSRLAGFLVHLQLPRPLAAWSIRTFGNFYKINFAEAEKPPEAYKSIGDFFVRRLKEGLRPLGGSLVVHPADSRISQAASIADGKLVQAKGKLYSLQGLLCADNETEVIQKYQGGFFATYYLCPTDYHRVHSPVTGAISSVTHVPGALWPVNEWSVNRIEELFCVNERVIVEIQTSSGPVALVMVGATNVGKISLSFEPQILSNQAHVKSPQRIVYSPAKPVKKGDELGAFHMGSTVVMLYSAGVQAAQGLLVSELSQWQGKAVRVGEDFRRRPQLRDFDR